MTFQLIIAKTSPKFNFMLLNAKTFVFRLFLHSKYINKFFLSNLTFSQNKKHQSPDAFYKTSPELSAISNPLLFENQFFWNVCKLSYPAQSLIYDIHTRNVPLPSARYFCFPFKITTKSVSLF